MIIEYAGGPSLALNLCKKHQIGYAGVHSYSCTCMTCMTHMPIHERICMKCPHTSHAEGDQFLSSQHA